MQINVTFDQSISSLPAGFVNAIDYVVNYYDTLFTNNVAINLDVGYGEIDGQALASGALGESEAANYVPESYSSVRNALIGKDAPGASTLPVSQPLLGQLYLSQAEAQALGLTSAISTNYVGFSSIYPLSYAANLTPPSNEFYFIGIAEHEISEDMGRVSLLDGQPDYYSPLDLFRYTSSGVRDTSTGAYGSTAYFSINNGNTNLGTWNNNPNNGDLADWYPSGPAPGGNDAFNDYSDPGVINSLSANDITLMQALGWTTTRVSVSGQNLVVAQKQAVSISNYFAVSNPNDDTITEYEFEDLGGGSGYFTINGTAQPANQVFTVSAANLSTVQYVGGPSPGTDVLEVGVFDATANSVDWSSSFTAATQAIIRTDTNSYGSTSLAQVGSNYLLFADGTTLGPALQYNGSAVTAGEFAGWTPIGAVQTGSGYDVAWQNTSTGQYTVWSIDSNGNYTGNVVGAVAGNSYALESLEPLFQQDLNGDGTVGLTTTLIHADGSTNLTEVANQFYLYNGGGTGPALQYQGAPVVDGQFGAWVPIAAVQTATGYDVAWAIPGSNEYTVWAVNSSGQYTGNVVGAVSGTSAALASLTSVFGQSLTSDANFTSTVIQTDNATSLTSVGNELLSVYYLDASNGSGPALQYSGADVVPGEFYGWTPIGAVQTASGYDVAWQNTDGQYTVWSTDSNGNYTGNVFGAVAGTSSALEALEPVFDQNLNGDGQLTTTVKQTDGSTSLTAVSDQVATVYYLDNTNGSDPALQYNGADVTAGEFAGWTPIGAVQTASGYDIAWKNTDGQYTVWSTNSSGQYTGNVIGAVAGTSYALESLESTFGQDLNGDGTTGLTTTVIKTDGSTSLTQVANQYDLDNSGTGTGPALQYSGADVTIGEFAGWTPIGAVQTASGYDIAWQNTDGQYTVWSTNSSGQYTGNVIGAVSATSTALEQLEPVFGQDLNGDGVTGLYAAPDTTLQISSALSGATGAATIGAGATLALAAADSAAVTFAASTGELVLSNPSTFTGEISGFTGNGTLAGSDQIDLKGLSDSGLTDSYSNGVLTLTSGGQTDKLDFNGSYVLANFSFASDGSGGTIVYDPPVSPASTAAPTGGRPQANLALFRNYIASSFPAGGTSSDKPLAPSTAWDNTHQSLLTNPHHA
jgi:hypothetical protein